MSPEANAPVIDLGWTFLTVISRSTVAQVYGWGGVTHLTAVLQSEAHRLAISNNTSAWRGWSSGHQQAKSRPRRSRRISASDGPSVRFGSSNHERKAAMAE